MELSKSIQTFYKNVIESSSNEEADDDTELMMAATMLRHEHTSRPVYRGSVKGRKANVKRNRERGHYQLYHNYFHHTRPIFDVQRLRHRYRMSRKLFLTILNGVRAHDSYFTARPDATGRLGFTSNQKYGGCGGAGATAPRGMDRCCRLYILLVSCRLGFIAS
jgi:hypothetical protein